MSRLWFALCTNEKFPILVILVGLLFMNNCSPVIVICNEAIITKKVAYRCQIEHFSWKKCLMNVAPAWSNDEYPKLPEIFAVLCNKINSFKSFQDFLKNKFLYQKLLETHFWISFSNTQNHITTEMEIFTSS